MIERLITHKIVSPGESDLSSVNQINRLCFTNPWTFSGLKEDINNPISKYFILKKDNNLIGYIGIWFILDEAQVVNIAVHPSFQSNGYASLLLDHSISICKRNSTSILTLEVRESNLHAINLYKKFHFEIVGKRPKYYSSPVENAVLMNLNLT